MSEHPWREALEGTIIKMGERIKALERERKEMREKCFTQRRSIAIADKIIADYLKHYSFPPQGESHMHDCIVDSLLRESYAE